MTEYAWLEQRAEERKRQAAARDAASQSAVERAKALRRAYDTYEDAVVVELRKGMAAYNSHFPNDTGLHIRLFRPHPNKVRLDRETRAVWCDGDGESVAIVTYDRDTVIRSDVATPGLDDDARFHLVAPLDTAKARVTPAQFADLLLRRLF